MEAAIARADDAPLQTYCYCPLRVSACRHNAIFVRLGLPSGDPSNPSGPVDLEWRRGKYQLEHWRELEHRIGSSERQDLIWRIIDQHLPPDEQLRISMIYTVTPKEMPRFDE